MIDLITRLEQAEAGSRELDAAIFKGLGGPLPPKFMGMGITLEWQADGSALFPVGEMQIRYSPPAYTTSLDAITALIGEKLPGWMKGYQDDPKGARAYLSDPDSGRATSSLAKTPATAFCIALLRAIKDGEHG